MNQLMNPPELSLTARATALLKNLGRAIGQVDDLAEVKDLRARTAAFAEYAKQAGSSRELLYDIAELKLRAERKCGVILKDMQLRGGDRRSNNRGDCLKLDDFGVTQNDSTRWQKIASISDQSFDRYCQEQRERAEEITQRGLLRTREKQEESPRDHIGLKCPYCGLRQQRCQKTHRVMSVIRKRDHLCLHCDRKFLTIEYPVDPRSIPRVLPLNLKAEDVDAFFASGQD